MKNIIKLIFGAMLSLPLVGGAVPAKPGLLKRVNPDGTVTEFYLHGDEYSHWTTDASGREGAAPLRKPAAQGGLRRTQATVRDGRTTFPTVNDSLRCLVVLMQFADTKFTTADPEAAFDDWLNKEGYSEWGATGSVRDFYIASSRGLFRPHFDVSPVVTISMTSAEATQAYPGCFDEALALVAQTGKVDFSHYDADGNGEIDFVYFIYAGYGYADTGIESCIWPHAYQLTPATYGGLQTGSYACSMELRGSHYLDHDGCLAGIGTFCHEFGHVLGLPDYYDVAYSGALCPDSWDTMAAGAYNLDSTCPPLMSAFERWMLRWEEMGQGIRTLSESCEVTLQAHSATASDAAIERSTDDPDEYFIYECRSRRGWDAGLPGEGLIIWHIAYSDKVWNANQVNTSGVSRCTPVRVVAADQSSAAFPAGAGCNLLSPNSFGLQLLDGTTMPTVISDITYDGAQASFGYNTRQENTLTTHVTAAAQGADGRSSYKIRLQWAPVEGATAYMLTLSRVNKLGHSYIMGGADCLDLGNVTSFELGGITSSQMDQTWTATLRVVTDLPSALTTDYEFVPSTLPDISGVENIDAEGAVEVARYSLDGRRLTSPAAGINIVIYSNGSIQKVEVHK